MHTFIYDKNRFLFDGNPFTVISGAMHYFRIPREYWRDRLTKLKQCGFNTVETYVCWNLHEEKEGVYDFTGMLDISEFLSLAESLDLNIILRPGPYICAEWDAGGLPSWLLSYKNMALRCADPFFIEKVRRYFYRLFEEIRPHLLSQGGGVIMVQIENEYGSYGNDKEYLRAIADIYRSCGVDCMLFTSDGASPLMLAGGTLDGVLSVVNFGSDPEKNLDTLKEFRNDQPLMCGEFWCGWFDHCYEKHHTRNAKEMAKTLETILSRGASFNMYMFHGGTNFGFTNGANMDGIYRPTVTSYDYAAPVSECGDLTPAFFEVRKAIGKHFGDLPELTVKNSEKAAYGIVSLNESASVFDFCSVLTPLHFRDAKCQEDFGQSFGYTMYSTFVNGPIDDLPLEFEMLHDRAVIYMDGSVLGIFERDRKNKSIRFNIENGRRIRLDILAENMGRINYGPHLADRKGITGVRLGQQYHFGWDHYPLEMKDLSSVPYLPFSGSFTGSRFLRGFLSIDGIPKDTFVRLDGFHRGIVIVNGFNLGRYYNDAGPQKTLYCPAPFLKEGMNEIVVFESDGSETNVIDFTDSPEL